MPKNHSGQSRRRPSLPGSGKLLQLREPVYNLWRARKTAMGFANTTDSAFAEVLLHSSCGGNRGNVSSVEVEFHPTMLSDVELMSRSDDDNGDLPVMSTPLRAGATPKFASPALQLGQSSTLSDSIVDITWQGDPERTWLQLFDQGNDSLPGNPFSDLEKEDQGASADSDTTSEEDESPFVYDNHHFADLEQSMDSRIDPLYGDCDSSHQFDGDADAGHVIGAREASAVTVKVCPQNASGQQEELGGSRSAESRAAVCCSDYNFACSNFTFVNYNVPKTCALVLSMTFMLLFTI